MKAVHIFLVFFPLVPLPGTGEFYRPEDCHQLKILAQVRVAPPIVATVATRPEEKKDSREWAPVAWVSIFQQRKRVDK